jgi:uncharacterized membrane protein YphA (DoxX/SURF4 family)
MAQLFLLVALQATVAAAAAAAGGPGIVQIVDGPEDAFFEMVIGGDGEDDDERPRFMRQGRGNLSKLLNGTGQLVERRLNDQRRSQQRMGLFEAMRRQQMQMQREQVMRAREMIKRAKEAPPSIIGGYVLPLLLCIALASCCFRCCGFEAEHDRLQTTLSGAVAASPCAGWMREAVRAVRRRGWALHDVTRVCVCMFFLHEGFAVFQLKSAQWEQAQRPMWTPFGLVGSVPSWDKGDACDMILLFTTIGTLFKLLPGDLGLILLLLDVLTDTLDLTARIFLAWMTGNGFRLDELTAKKLSLLGVMALVATHRWREERQALSRAKIREARGGKDAPLSSAAELAHTDAGSASGSLPLPPLVLLVGRLLTSVVFFYAAGGELARVLMPSSLSDINPDDPHNIIWPKLVEFALAVPFVFGWRTVDAARALTATLVVEAITIWPWFFVPSLQQRLHAREHFTVNMAVAGGLLLVQSVGGGRYAVDELLKKAE